MGVAGEFVDRCCVNSAGCIAVEGVENGCIERGITEGDGFITEVADAGGVVGGVEICRCTIQRGDGAGVNGS